MRFGTGDPAREAAGCSANGGAAVETVGVREGTGLFAHGLETLRIG
jgi:hypothetical protein